MGVDGAFLERLAVAAREGRAELRPEVVLCGSNWLALDLGRRLAERTGGWGGIRFLTFIDLAGALACGDPHLSGRPLLGTSGKEALAREALRRASREPDHPFAALAGRPGLPGVLAALLDDVTEAGIRELPPEGGPVEPRRWRAIAGVHREWRSLLSKRGNHPAEVIERGAARAGEFRRAFGCERLWMAGFYDLTPVQESLLRAIAAAGIRLTASLPFPENRAGEFAARLREFLGRIGADVLGPEMTFPRSDLGRLQALLFAPGSAGEKPVRPGRKPAAAGASEIPLEDGSLAIISAPDEEREAREAARALLRLHARGFQFGRMAVAYPGKGRDVYAPLLREALAEAGVPHHGRRLSRLAGEPEGRALRTLLGLLGEEAPSRTRFLDFLAFEPSRMPVSAGRIERLSRRGNVTAFTGDWAARLRAADRPRSAGGEGTPARAESADPGLEAAIRRITEMLADLAGFPRRAPWGEMAAALDRLLAGALPRVREAPGIAGAVEGLKDLAALEDEADLESLREAVEEALRSPPEGAREEGVLVGDLLQMRGLRPDALVVLGLAERSFPAPPSVDPLLPDADRSALDRELGLRLPLKGERIREEELLFAVLVTGARRHLHLSFPRVDGGMGRQRLPSIFLLRAAGSLAGREVSPEEVDGRVPGVTRIGLTHGEASFREALSVPELALALAVRGSSGAAGAGLPAAAARRAVEAVLPGAARLIASEEIRWRPRLGPADGLLDPALAAKLPGARITGADGYLSPTGLEAYATCPHRYLLRHVLGLDEPREPEEVFTISPLDRGALAHRVLERTFRELSGAGLLPLSEERLGPALAVLDRVFAAACREAEQEMAVGIPLLWERAREELRADLGDLLESEVAAGGQWIPIRFEEPFGGKEIAVRLEVPADGDAPAWSARFRGKIDRLDRLAAGGAVRVVDYKTGKSLPAPPFDQGRSIQLPVYLLAGKALLESGGGAVDLSRSEAVYLSLRGETEEFSGEGWEAALEKLRRAVGTVARGIEQGLFFPTPGADRKNCDRCRFRDVCDPRVEAIAAQKDDARTGALDAMRQTLSNDRQEDS